MYKKIIFSVLFVFIANAACCGESRLPDTVVREVIETVSSNKINSNSSFVLENFNFTRMTMTTTGRYWRQVSPTQRQRLNDELKQQFLRRYAALLTQMKERSLEIKTLRLEGMETEASVRTIYSLKWQEPARIEYDLEKTDEGWKIFEIRFNGIGLVEHNRQYFAQELPTSGVDGLINKLAAANREAAK